MRHLTENKIDNMTLFTEKEGRTKNQLLYKSNNNAIVNKLERFFSIKICFDSRRALDSTPISTGCQK